MFFFYVYQIKKFPQDEAFDSDTKVRMMFSIKKKMKLKKNSNEGMVV